MNRHYVSPIAMIALVMVMIWTVSSCSDDSNPTRSGNPPADAVNISGSAFNPGNITIKAGSTVTWTNKDNVAHTVTSDDGEFLSSGNLAANATFQVTFPTAGTFPYHCAIHPSMTGTVTVTP